MKFPEKRVMYFASEIPALSATFVYNEIFQFEELICPVDVVSVRPPTAPANDGVQSRFGSGVCYLYGRSRAKRFNAVFKMLFKHPFRFSRAVLALLTDLISVRVVSRTAAGLGFRFIYAAILGEEMERRKIDHLHVHFAHIPGDIAMYASMMTSIPFSITGHANDIYERGWLLKQKADRSKFLATISEFNKRALVGKGCDSNKIETVRCGIDQSEFRYCPPSPVADKTVRIGSLGRLVPKKGFQTLVEACEILRKQSIEFVLEIAGDGPLREQLQLQINSSGLHGNIKLLGAMPHHEVSRWMQSLDVFALACCEDNTGDVDGIPVVLMEAMAVGVPVASTDVTGLPELVVHEKTGLASKQKDARGFAESLIRLATDQQLRTNLSTNAAKRVGCEFSVQANVEKLGDLIFSN